MIVKRTKKISPSKIGLFDTCWLRYLAESEGVAGSRLPAGPAAYMGIAVHAVIEALIGQSAPEIALVRSALVEKLSEQLSSPRKSSQVAHAAFQRFGLRGVVPQARILLLCGYVKDVLARLPRQVGLTRLTTSTAPPSTGQLGIEKWVESESLAMAGRIDYSYLDDCGSLHVVDFKTGGVTDEGGAPKPAYLMQIAAYGLMLREAISVTKVRLHLEGPRGSWEGDLTQELENRVKYAAREINRSLPFENPFDAQEIASPGEHCSACSVRPSCAKYLAALSAGANGESLPFAPVGDLFGNVVETKVVDGLVRVQMERPGIGRVTITGIPEALWPKRDAVFMFALRTNEVLGRARYIANYHALDVAQPQRSAFECLIISGGGSMSVHGD
jgi:hypothetical protein